MKSYKKFLNEAKSKSAQEIADYITYITPDSSDVPDFFIEKILKSNKTFTLKKVKVKDVIRKDKDVKEYIKSGEDRYGEDSEEWDEIPHDDELDNPIVIFNDEVLDGYSRLSTHYREDIPYISAYTT